MQILYEDNHLIAVNKPAGVLTQPSPKCSESVETELKRFIKEREKKSGNVYLHAVHRLDKDVSGVVLFAKTQKALSRLAQTMREGKCKKQYEALIEKEMPTGILIDRLVHDHHRARVDPEGKRSELIILHCEPKGDFWLVTLQLITGRYHQIRVQLASRGYPIVGDTKYGSCISYSCIALHHCFFGFDHPTTKQWCEVQSPSSFLGAKGKSS